MDRELTLSNGVWFEQHIAGIIQSRFPESVILHDVHVFSKYLSLIKNHDYSTQIDLIAILPCGIYVIEAKKWNYEIVGDRDDELWTGKSNPKSFIQNVSPILQNMCHIRALRNLLRINNYDVPRFESCICVPDDTNIVSNCGEVMELSQLIYKLGVDMLYLMEGKRGKELDIKYWEQAIADTLRKQNRNS